MNKPLYIKGFDQDLQTNLNAGLEKVEKAFKSVKFDVVVGNPPYQKDAAGDSSKQDPIYHRFMELSYKLADKVALITPARFLFNAGGTPKDFNQKMLEDKHLNVIYYEQDSSKVFPSTDIKGGVVVTYRDKDIVSGPIGTFISSQELTSIANKVAPLLDTPLSTIISGRGVYQLSSLAHQDFPEIERLQSKGHKNDIGTSAFKVLKDTVLHEEKPADGHAYIKLLGLDEKKRAYRWIREDYVSAPPSLNSYKVILPNSNGSGAIGEVLSTPLVGSPLVGSPLVGSPLVGSPLVGSPLVGSPLVGFTETFISIGEFETQLEADNCLKYIKTKFCRANLGILKITQHNTREKWLKVPLQDFSTNSDIPWHLNISEIDQHLYNKYNLSPEDIEFIESRVSSME